MTRQSSDEGTTTCARCGATAVLDHLFEKARFGFGGSGPVCPWCRVHARALDQSAARRYMTALFGVVLVLFAVVWAITGEWKLRGAPIYGFGAVVPLVILHELIHAAAAWTLRGRVHRLQLGWGRDWLRTRVGRTALVVTKDLPLGGACWFSFAQPRMWRIAIAIGAPAAAHIGLALATWGHVFGYVNAALAVFALLPYTFGTEYGKRATDGLLLWRLVTGKLAPSAFASEGAYWVLEAPHDREATYAAAHKRAAALPDDVGARAVLAICAAATERWGEAFDGLGDIAAATAANEANTAVGAFTGERLATYLRVSWLVQADRLDEAFAVLEAAHAAEEDECARAIWADGMGLVCTMRGDEARAREFVAFAHDRVPWIPYVRALRALYDDSLPELQRAERNDVKGEHRGTIRALRALVHARRGDFAAARQSFAAAGPAVFPGLRRLIEAELTRGGGNAR